MSEGKTIDISDLIDRRKISRFQILVAFLCGLVAFLDGFDTQVIGYMVPVIAKSWQIEPSALRPAITSGLFGLMIGALSFGVIADRVGRRTVIVLCTLFFGACMAMTATAQSVGGIEIWRFLTGLGLGGAMPNSIALTAEYAPRRSRATMVMVMFFGFSFGAAIAGLLAGVLIAHFDWQAVFYFGSALPIFLAPILMALLPESIRVLTLRGTENRRIAALLARIDPTLIFGDRTTFTMSEGKATGFPVRQLFLEGRAPRTVLLWLLFFMNLLCLFILASWLPTVINAAGIPLETAVFASAMAQVGGCAGVLILGPLMDRFGRYRVLPMTFLAAAIFIPLIPLSGSAVGMVVLTVFGAGFCVVGGQTSSNAVAATIYPTFIRSTGVGWALGIGRIGSIVGPTIAGAMLARHVPAQTIFLAASFPALCAAAAAFLLGRVKTTDTA